MKYGFYYDAGFVLPFAEDPRPRHIRVWLPEDYDFEDEDQAFPVIYMSDGQNLVNRYLSAYGDWELDKCIHALYKEGLPTCIVVGIDCPESPTERACELNPPFPPDNTKELEFPVPPYGDRYYDYVVDVLKPLIDSLFYTNPDREHTAVGGSSMGGIYAFSAWAYHPDVFGFSLSFSPAFLLYKKSHWKEILNGFDFKPRKNGKLFLYSGAKEYEAAFYQHTVMTYDYLRRRGFTTKQIALMIDSQQIHHEAAWAKYLHPGMRFWLEGLE